MSFRSTSRKVYHGFLRALRVASRPVRRNRGHRGLAIQPYRGFGTQREIYLMGRVFRQPQFGRRLREATALRDVVDIARRIGRWGLGGATLIARCNGSETRLTTDRDGYFHLHMELETPPSTEELWHRVDLELHHRDEVITDVAEVFIPPESARFVVVSDIDDTVMKTGVANVAVMLYRLFVMGADSRTAFPGVPALYRALHAGASGVEHNPMLYVSRGPWSIYEVLEEFFHLHRIPVGPVLFLREWGLTLQRPLPKRSRDHKEELIDRMLEKYRALPFILIGDSGQHDPEIYAKVIRKYPDRIEAVYIRDVSDSPSRNREIEELAREVAKANVDLLLTADTTAMARHAARRGWISESRLAGVVEERLEEATEDVPRDVRTVGVE
jgi:phosphatidate phosphatase APP1